MASIADYKKQIRFNKQLRSNVTLRNLFGGNVDDKFSKTVQKAIESVLPEIMRETVEALVNTPAFKQEVLVRLYNAFEKPRNGNDGKEGPRGPKGEQGQKGEPGKDSTVPGPKGDPGPKGNDGSPDTGEGIIDKINKADEKKKIPASRISGLPTKDKREGAQLGSVHRGGIKLIWDTELQGTVNGVNTVFTIPSDLPEPKEGRIVISARGVLKFADANDLTISGRTVTFTSAPPNGSAQPRVVLYHGK